MDKSQIKKIARKVIKASFPFGPSDYRPQHAIWSQKQNNLRAFVSVINNKYKYEIYKEADVSPTLVKMRPHGEKLKEGYKDTLSSAKEEVLKYFKKNK